jgi:hypothetical protein
MAQFTAKNRRFGKRAQEKAWEKVYREYFPGDMLTRDLWRTERDYEHDEDVEVEVFKSELSYPVQISVQERFRRKRYAKHRDVTIAYYDEANDEPSHLFDSHADLLLYGYYDGETDTLLETVLADMTQIKVLVARGAVDFDTRKHGEKLLHFVAISFDQLQDEGAILHRHTPE